MNFTKPTRNWGGLRFNLGFDLNCGNCAGGDE